jgi:hypothetical protein
MLIEIIRKMLTKEELCVKVIFIFAGFQPIIFKNSIFMIKSATMENEAEIGGLEALKREAEAFLGPDTSENGKIW